MAGEAHVLLCTSTFKRDWQLKESLTLNLPQTMAWHLRVTWCVFDANPTEELWDWARHEFAPLIQGGHLIWLRCAEVPGWETFHMSVAKTTAHCAGMDASLADRCQALVEAGLTADDPEKLADNTFLVNWDNDGIMCVKWLHEVMRKSSMIIKGIDKVHPLVGVQWLNSHLGTCGKIGVPWRIFEKVGGYDESMLAMSCQDVFSPSCLDRRSAEGVGRPWLHCVQPRGGVGAPPHPDGQGQEEGGL